MLRNLLSVLLFTGIIFACYQLSYPSQTPPDLYYDGLRVSNKLELIEKISRKAHPTGTSNNRDVRRYLVKALQSIGGQVTLQRTTGFNAKHRIAAPIVNVVAEFPASPDNDRPKLLLLSHFDSAKPFAKGAGDAGSGVAVILEVLRNHLKKHPERKNDIVVVFTDGEELGLLGAHAFVTQHHLADDIGLVLNFEARGSSGPGIMWPETQQGTAPLIDMYQSADVPFPVTSSLIYDIYRLLPNDTDMTVFSHQGDIPGMNFAFIDDHFNYHTEQDDVRHLSYNSLMHQALQLHALLPVAVNADLSQLNSSGDHLYFTLPGLGLVVWPELMVWLLIGITWLLAIWACLHGRRQSKARDWLRSGVVFAGVMAAVYLAIQVLMWLIYGVFKPELNDLLQGFPYWGHGYILVTWLLTLSITATVLGRFQGSPSPLVPACLWTLVFSYLAWQMPGGGFLLLPVVVAWIYIIWQQHMPSIQSYALVFAVVAIMPLALLFTLLPVALGLKMVWVPALLLAWFLSLFAPMMAPQKIWQGMILLLLPLAMFYWVLERDQFTTDLKRTSSLSYLFDVDQSKGWYYSYDHMLTDWNDHLFEEPANDMAKRSFYENHHQSLRHLQALNQPIPLEAAVIEEQVDRLNVDPAKKHITYDGSQFIDQVRIYTENKITIEQLSINGRYLIKGEPVTIHAGGRILTYHLDGQKHLDMHWQLSEGDTVDWRVISTSFDLLYDDRFGLKQRPEDEMAKPFIHTDNTMVSQRFRLTSDSTLDDNQ